MRKQRAKMGYPAGIKRLYLTRHLLRFTRHGTREHKNGAAKHQRIRHVIEALEAGALYYRERHIDDQLNTEHSQARPRRCCASFLANKQQDTRDCVNRGCQVRPNGMAEDVGGSHQFQRNAGNVIGMPELLEAVKQHGNGNEVSRNRRKNVGSTLARLLSEAGCQRQSAAAEG